MEVTAFRNMELTVLLQDVLSKSCTERTDHGPTIWNITVYGIRASFVLAKCKNSSII